MWEFLKGVIIFSLLALALAILGRYMFRKYVDGQIDSKLKSDNDDGTPDIVVTEPPDTVIDAGESDDMDDGLYDTDDDEEIPLVVSESPISEDEEVIGMDLDSLRKDDHIDFEESTESDLPSPRYMICSSDEDDSWSDLEEGTYVSEEIDDEFYELAERSTSPQVEY